MAADSRGGGKQSWNVAFSESGYFCSLCLHFRSDFSQLRSFAASSAELATEISNSRLILNSLCSFVCGFRRIILRRGGEGARTERAREI